MGKPLEAVMAELPAHRRRAIEARAKDLIAEEMTLRELRKVMGKTQVQLARRLGKPQTTISRIEAQSDMLISTLGAVIEGLGGRLRIRAELPGHATVELTGLGDIIPPKGKAPTRASRRLPRERPEQASAEQGEPRRRAIGE